MFRKLWFLIKAWWSNSLIERGDMFLYSLSLFFTPLVIMLVWLVINSSGADTIMSYNQLAVYFLASTVVKTFTSAWLGQFLPGRIRRGDISPHLTRPAPFLLDPIGNNVAEKAVKFIYIIPLVVITGMLIRIDWPSLNLWEYLLVALSLTMGAVIYFVLDASIGLMAFWIDETKALQELYGLLESFFSGRLIPLVMLPLFWQKISFFLPFRYTLSLPIEMLLRQVSGSQLVLSMMIQALFLLMTIVIYREVRSRGLKLYSASGA